MIYLLMYSISLSRSRWRQGISLIIVRNTRDIIRINFVMTDCWIPFSKMERETLNNLIEEQGYLNPSFSAFELNQSWARV